MQNQITPAPVPSKIDIRPNLIVANKPAGLPTTYRNETDSRDCFMKQISQQHPEISSVKGHKPKDGGLIYRLDNDTSGIVVFARNQKSFDNLKTAQNNNRLVKYYYSICKVTQQFSQMTHEKHILSIIPEEEFSLGELSTLLPISFFEMLKCTKSNTDPSIEYSRITYPIGHSRKSQKKMIAILNKRYKSRGKPRPAITYFREICRKENLVLIEAIITKGTRHQIRIHLGTLGIKIAGDDLYNSKSQLKPSPQRMFLHCGKVILLKSPLDQI